MGISRDRLIQITHELLDERFRALGFTEFFECTEDEYGLWVLDYGYKGRYEPFGLNLFIDFQPRGDANFVFGIYVNLIRTDSEKFFELSETQKGPVAALFTRLSPEIFVEGYTGPVWKWDCTTEPKVRRSLEDVYESTLNYGIPFLEDPNSTMQQIWTRTRKTVIEVAPAVKKPRKTTQTKKSQDRVKTT